MTVFQIALGGAFGALSRWAVGGWVQEAAGPGFPLGTLLINVTGSFLLAFLMAFLEGVAAPPAWRSFLAVGFCGAYTTFSTFSYETARLLQGGDWSRATMYLFGSVFVSLASTLLGFRAAAALLSRRM
jgi:CrcB protein